MWTLILFIYAGALSKGDSVALTHVQGFKTEQVCQEAGRASKSLARDTFKDVRFVCVKAE